MYIFLSCSFHREDADVNEVVTGILTGLGLVWKNVSTASHRPPAEEAKELIRSASAVIAIATRRDRVDGGSYKMPDSVRDEIGIAYGLGKPVLLLLEEGIAPEGFLNNYGTFLEFERQSIARPVFVQRVIEAARSVTATIPRSLAGRVDAEVTPQLATTSPAPKASLFLAQDTLTSFASRNDNTTGRLLKRLQRDINRTITTNDDELVVDQALAILSYDTFWKLLIEKLARNPGLVVHAVHSSTMEVWTANPDLLARQRQFCERGGKIVRILCDRATSAAPAIVEAAALMTAIGVEVLYYDILSRRVLDHTFTWDFAIVNVSGDLAIWESIGPNGDIVKAVFASTGEYKGYDLSELWEEIAAVAKPIPE